MKNILWDLSSEKIVADLKLGKRADSRKFDGYREISLKRNFIKNADGSCGVKLGETEVLVGVKMFPNIPYPDTPDKGSICVGAELLALASPEFEAGPPREGAIELARVVDRCIRESKTLDFESFCITEGEKAWFVFIDLYVLNNDGNLFDACSLGALAALLGTNIPKLEDDQIVKGEYSGKLKLSRKPLLTTHAKIANQMVLDPTEAEEKAMSARFSVATTDDGMICAFQKGGSGSIMANEVDKCIDTAFRVSKDLRALL